MSTAAFAYGEPFNVSASLILDPGGEGGNSYWNQKIGIDLKVTASCRASSPYTNDAVRMEHPTTAQQDEYTLAVSYTGAETDAAKLWFNYPTTIVAANTNWANGNLPKTFTTVTGTTGSYTPPAYNWSLLPSGGGVHFTVRHTSVNNSTNVANYINFTAGDKINITWTFKLRCTPTKATSYAYTGNISFIGVKSAGTANWQNNMTLTSS